MTRQSYLNKEHIALSTADVEYHPLLPFLPPNAKVLFLGSFPPQRKRWCMDFYYPNFLNDHWRIEGEVFFGNRQHFVDVDAKTFRVDDVVAFCRERGLAFFDTATAVRRQKGNAADQFLEVVEPTDIRALLRQLPHCEVIVTTGQKATDVLCAYFDISEGPKVGASVAIPNVCNSDGRQVFLYRLPSSSRAYPLAFDKKVSAYRKMFAATGLCHSLPALEAGLLLTYDLGPDIVAFSTKRRGHQPVALQKPDSPYAAFNINRYCGDDAEHVARNRAALCHFLGIADEQLVMPHQNHHTCVARIGKDFFAMDADGRQAALEGVDALMTDMADVCIGVSTADCIPILISDAAHHAVCAVHAGWRGTVGRIAEQAVAAMTHAYGSRPAELRAQIGPGISLGSFEVGQEVYDAFAHAGFAMDGISHRYPARENGEGEKWHIDLPACNRQQLLACGLKPEAVADCGICTYQEHEQFFSARRLGISSGRIFTGIVMRK